MKTTKLDKNPFPSLIEGKGFNIFIYILTHLIRHYTLNLTYQHVLIVTSCFIEFISLMGIEVLFT